MSAFEEHSEFNHHPLLTEPPRSVILFGDGSPSLISPLHLPAYDSHFITNNDMFMNPRTSWGFTNFSSGTITLESSLIPYSNAALLPYGSSVIKENSYLNVTSSFITSNSSIIPSSSAANQLFHSQQTTKRPDDQTRHPKRQREMIEIAATHSLDGDHYFRYVVQQLMLGEKLKYSQKQKPMLQIPTPQCTTMPTEPLQSKKFQSQLALPYNVDHPISVPRMPLTKGGACARRMMYYLYNLSHRPQNNSLAYWRNFVNEYYAPAARKRFCFSLYKNVGCYAQGIFSENALGSLPCDICSKPRKGLETTFEVLPRFCQRKFENGVKDELLYLDCPAESHELTLGNIMLKYDKAVMETIHENLRVVHEGKLQIIFTPDFKIKSWLFCLQRHEEFVPRRVVAPQVEHLLDTAAQYHNNIYCSDSSEELKHTLSNNKSLLKAGKQVIRTLGKPRLCEVGFSSPFIRFMQVSEVVDSMKDLMTFSMSNHDFGPIESLKRYAKNEKENMNSNIANSRMMYSGKIAPYNPQTQYEGPFSTSGGGGGGFMTGAGATCLSRISSDPSFYATDGPGSSGPVGSISSSMLGTMTNISPPSRRPNSSASTAAQRSSKSTKGTEAGEAGVDPFYLALLQVKSEPVEY